MSFTLAPRLRVLPRTEPPLPTVVTCWVAGPPGAAFPPVSPPTPYLCFLGSFPDGLLLLTSLIRGTHLTQEPETCVVLSFNGSLLTALGSTFLYSVYSSSLLIPPRPSSMNRGLTSYLLEQVEASGCQLP